MINVFKLIIFLTNILPENKLLVKYMGHPMRLRLTRVGLLVDYSFVSNLLSDESNKL